MNLHLAVCDDVPADAAYISGLARSWADRAGHVIRVDTFPSAERFLFTWDDDSTFDILLLDIEMGGMNGIELARRLRQRRSDVQIIFVTGYPDFMSEGYDVSALHYLMKPVKYEKLAQVLDRGVSALSARPRTVLLPDGKDMIRLREDAILYGESDGHYVVVHTDADTLRLRMTVPDLCSLLGDKAFARCGRSFVVGLRHIRRVTKDGVLLTDGTSLPLGKGYGDSLRASLVRYLREK